MLDRCKRNRSFFSESQPIQPCFCIMAQMVHREYGNVYDEVNALSTLLGYKTSNAGCCKASSIIPYFVQTFAGSWISPKEHLKLL